VLAGVVGAEQGGRLDPGPDGVGRVVAGRLELPDAGEGGVGALGEADVALGRVGPGAAEVVGVAHDRAPVARLGAGQQPPPAAAAVEADGVDGLAGEVGAAGAPLAPVGVAGEQECALGGADGQQYVPRVDGEVLVHAGSLPHRADIPGVDACLPGAGCG
jgi:hypothetical protein